MKHDTEIKIRGYHLDGYQHVNNARYLEFLEEDRWARFDQSDLLAFFEARSWGLVVVNINISYRRAAVVNDVINVRTTLKSLVQKKGILRQEIYLSGTDTLICEADVMFVLYDMRNNQTVIIDDDIKAAFEALFKR